MTNKIETLATVLPDIRDYLQKHANEIPEYMQEAFLQVPSLEDDEVKDFQGGGEVESPYSGTLAPSQYAGIEYDDEGKPIVNTSYPMGIEEQTALDSMLNIDAMSDKAFVAHHADMLNPDTNALGLAVDKIKSSLGLEALPDIPAIPISKVGIIPAAIAIIDRFLSPKIAEGAINSKYGDDPDKKINIMRDIVARAFPISRQDSEFFRGMPQPGLAPTTSKAPRSSPSSQSYTTQPHVPTYDATQKDRLDRINREAALATKQANEERELKEALNYNIEENKEKTVDFQSRAEQEAMDRAFQDEIDASLSAAPEQQAMDREAQGSGSGSGSGSGGTGGESGPSGVGHGGRNRGGPVNMQLGGEAENADTNMEVANVPMGVVSDRDGAPGPFRGGTGVEDDLDMEVEAGSYVLNAESVQLVGISDINKVIRDAYTIAAKLGKPLPEDYDPQNKVPIRISNGEAVIPKSLVDIIGLDKLEKWNQKGLQLRKQKEKMMAEQQQAQPPQQQQVASEAPPVQPQSPMQAQMGGLMGYNQGDEVEEDDFSIKKKHGGSVNFNKNYLRIIEKHRGKDHNVDPDFFEAAGTYITNNKNNPKLSEPALLYNAIHSAEWRSSSDTKLRNKNDTYRFTGFDKLNKEGLASSAFGPVQLTYTRINTLLDKYGGRLSPELKNYAEKLVLQGKLRNNSISRQETLLGNTLPPRDTAFYEAGIDRDRELLNLQEHEVDRKKGIAQKTFKERVYDPRLSGKKEGLLSREEHKEYYRDLADLHIRDHVMTTRIPPKGIPRPKIN